MDSIFYGWAHDNNYEVISQHKVQETCNALRDICKEMVNNAVNEKKDD